MTKTNQQKVKDFLINNGVIIVMFILVIYTGFTSDNFFTKEQLHEYSDEYEFTTRHCTWYRRLCYHSRM